MNLALTGAIKDKILPLDEVVFYGLEYLINTYPETLKERYDITSIEDALFQIATKRGALLKGGHIDEDRVYHLFLTDLRSNKLGGLTFDTLDV